MSFPYTLALDTFHGDWDALGRIIRFCGAFCIASFLLAPLQSTKLNTCHVTVLVQKEEFMINNKPCSQSPARRAEGAFSLKFWCLFPILTWEMAAAQNSTSTGFSIVSTTAIQRSNIKTCRNFQPQPQNLVKNSTYFNALVHLRFVPGLFGYL